MLNFIDPGMCSPAIVFTILKISHVFSRYRLIAERHIKNRPHTLQCFPDFFAKCVWQIFNTGCTTKYIREPQCLSPCPNWDSAPSPVSECAPPPTPGAKGLLEKSLALCLLCWLSKNREKYIKKVLRIVLDYRRILYNPY